ncbi:MAG: sulfur-carrier protein [Solirubrobacteraceae bacterium]|jgi:molybdopterin synthase sulfur carrier subunit|nr:sulfur-carrier protein [Solirubrobacteraceae bacterium]
MQVRVRLGAGLARLTAAPLVGLDLDDGATVADAVARLAADRPELAEALPAALPVVAGAHAERDRPLRAGEELALVTPVSGG